MTGVLGVEVVVVVEGGGGSGVAGLVSPVEARIKLVLWEAGLEVLVLTPVEGMRMLLVLLVSPGIIFSPPGLVLLAGVVVLRALFNSRRLLVELEVEVVVEEEGAVGEAAEEVEVEVEGVEVEVEGRRERGLVRRTGDLGATNTRALLFSCTTEQA
ncbi:hypothetical protein FHG87_017515 [Trinorchestia longiramus]|nr:hypothetical protein FHG87_017515 [Trinorchestia longiramus]